MSIPELPADMKHHELAAGEETLDFYGKLLYAVDNDRGDRPRWAELRLYKIFNTDPGSEHHGKEMWLLYTVGHTMVYHCLDSECNKGIAVSAADFPERAEDSEGLEPCVVCNPADWADAPPGELFELEVTWYTYTPCATPEKVLDALRREPRCKNCPHKPHETYGCWCGCKDYAEGPRSLSVPGRRLIEQVKHLDPEIARAAARRVRF
jgi:hypothetical protein